MAYPETSPPRNLMILLVLLAIGLGIAAGCWVFISLT